MAFKEIRKFIFNSRNSEDTHIKSCIGAIGIRTDGAIIRSINGSIRNTYSSANNSGQSSIKSSKYHAEGRLLNKMDSGGVIFVARARQDNFEFAHSRPCDLCRPYILAYNIQKVYYTINKSSYGIWYPQKDVDKVFSLKE